MCSRDLKIKSKLYTYRLTNHILSTYNVYMRLYKLFKQPLNMFYKYKGQLYPSYLSHIFVANQFSTD